MDTVTILFGFNIHLKMSQLVFIVEIRENDDLALNLMFTLNSLDAHLAQRGSSNITLLSKTDNLENLVNTIDLSLNDFNLKYQLNSSEFIQVLGPITINTSLHHDLIVNELFARANLGSFNFTINKNFIHIIDRLSKYVNQASIELSEEPIEPKTYIPSVERFNDEFRSGIFKYKLIDNNYIKTMNSSSDNMHLFGHLTLPNVNEIVCVDDLFDGSFDSHVTWTYPGRRALTNLTIQPLPLVDATPSAPLTCYLEYLNDSNKQFILLKNFSITEGAQTEVLKLKEFTFSKLVYAKVWRIRLSNDAKKVMYASSLLLSTRVDSLEMVKPLNRKLYAHLDLAVDSINFKFNMVNHSELVGLSFSDLNLRIVQNNHLNSNEKSFIQTDIDLNGQLAVDYCEYRFLSISPMIDSFRFTVGVELVPKETRIDISADSVNVFFNQSALVTLKHLEKELCQSSSISIDVSFILNFKNSFDFLCF